MSRTEQPFRVSGLPVAMHLVPLAVVSGSILCFALGACGTGAGNSARATPVRVEGSGAVQSLTALNASAVLRLSMTPSGDSINAGVDWNVRCGGNPVTGTTGGGACGTFSPAHSANGAVTVYTAPSLVPVGTTISIVASLTSDPSQSSSLVLTIVAVPISVAFLNPTPASLMVSGSTGQTAAVTNDPTGAGVAWTAQCGAGVCGSFNPAFSDSGAGTTYTAPASVPAGGVVTISATSLTDTTRSASAQITILPVSPPPPVLSVSVDVVPASLYVATSGAARTARLNAVVNNDPAAAGVDWKLSCGGPSCGEITAHTASGADVSYTGPSVLPPGSTVLITASSTTDPTASSTSTATVLATLPVNVTIPADSALPASLMTQAEATLSAGVTPSTDTQGVDWTVSCASPSVCGSFNLSPAHTAAGGQIVYTAPSAVPAGGMITIRASSPAAQSNAAYTRTVILAQPPSISLLQAPPASLSSLGQATVSAVITNDANPGGVTWSVQCGSAIAGACGYISPTQTASNAHATYTAPPVTSPGSSVVITATSTAAAEVSVSSAPVSIVPSAILSIGFVPLPPTQAQVDSTVKLAASVRNDTSNAGVDWQVCASGCGFFTTLAATPAIAATLTSPAVPAMPAVTATRVTGWPNDLPLAYTAPSQAPASGAVVIAVSAHAGASTADSASIAINLHANGPQLRGSVQAGTQPVQGAAVALYAAANGGYGAPALAITPPDGPSTATTDAKGRFSFPAGYSCPSPYSQMYLVATGGHTGNHAANPNLALMTLLGSCNALSSSPLVINEVTSVASATTAAPFASNHPLTGNLSYLYLGTSAGNTSGLSNAFAAFNNLVDLATGQPRYTVPAGNAAVPYVEINTLADVLNQCTSTSGGVYGDGSPCGMVFNYAAVLGSNRSTSTFFSFAPPDTLQAAFNIALHPVTGYGYSLTLNQAPNIFSQVSSASPFQPTLSDPPNDWSVSLNYTGGGGLSGSSVLGSFAVDAAGNVWVTDTKAGSVIELNPLGAAISPANGFTAGGGPIAIDAEDNVWVSGDGSLNELTSLGASASGAPFGGVPGGGTDLAIDRQGNLWITSGDGVREFNSLGAAISPNAGYTNGAVNRLVGVAVDRSNNIWAVGQNEDTAATQGVAKLAELTNPGGQLITSSLTASTTAAAETPQQIAADGVGNVWVAQGGFVCRIPPFGGIGTLVTPACTVGSNGDTNNFGYAFVNPSGIAFDGAGTAWLASQGGSSGGTTFAPNVLPIIPGLPKQLTGTLVSPTLAAGTSRVAIDGSGNIWVLLTNNTLTEYVGAATPVITPVALGLKSGSLAARP